YEGHWALTGGHVHTGEAVRTAAARELAEETGLDIDDALIELGAWHAPGRDPRGRYVTVAYAADLPHRATATAADDATDARWWRVDALADLAVAFDHRRIITRALASRRAARSTARGPVGVQAAVVADTTVVQTWTRCPVRPRRLTRRRREAPYRQAHRLPPGPRSIAIDRTENTIMTHATPSVAATFAALFAALFVAHQVADHWVQTSHQAAHKGLP